jgi:hypothetical protein
MADYIRTSTAIISLLTGKRYASHEADRCEADNAAVKQAANARARAAGAKRDPSPAEILNGSLGLPKTPVSVNRRIALEKAQRDPTAETSPFLAALTLAKANQSVGNFTSSTLAKEIEALEQDHRDFEARRAKLATLPKAPEAAPDNPLQRAADSLRRGVVQPGDEKMTERMIASLESRVQKDAALQAVEQIQQEVDPALQRAIYFQRDELLALEKRSDVPQEWVVESRDRLRRLESGEMSVLEFWNVEVATFEERREAVKKEKLASNTEERARIDAEREAIRDDQPPAAPPETPVT